VANPVVGIDIVAKLDQFQKSMVSMGQMTKEQAAAMGRDLKKTIAESGKAAQQTADVTKTALGKVDKSMNATRAAAGNLQAQIFDIGAGLQGGQNPFTILVQQGPQVAAALTGVGGGMAALKAAMMSTLAIVGPVALAVGVAAGAWKAYAEDGDRAKAVSAEVNAALDKLQPMIDQTAAATLAYDVAVGNLTETQGKLIASNRALFAQFNATTGDTAKKLGELKASQSGVVTQMTDLALSISGALPTGWAMNKLIGGLTTSTDEYQIEIDALNAAQSTAIDRLSTLKTATEKQITAEAKRKTGVDSLAASIKAAAAEDKAWADMSAELTAWSLDQAAEKNEAGVKLAEQEVADGQALVDQERADIALVEKEQKASNARATRYAEMQAEAIAGVFGSAATGAAGLAALVAEEGIGSGKALFAVGKGLAIAEASINTYTAATKALTLGPVLGPIAAGVITAAGLVQVAQIASTEPKFHAGGMVDEVPATLLRGEAVLSTQGRAAIGDDAIRAANRGQAPSAQVLEVVQMADHKVFNRQTRHATRLPGSALSVALAKGRTVGHR